MTLSAVPVEEAASPLLPLEGALSPRGGPRGEFVYRSLLNAIREGRLKSGDRVREEDVANALGVSRTPVREAIQLLQARNLIEYAPGRGLVIATLTAKQVADHYLMREVLEGTASRLAAKHATPAEIALLRQIQTEFAASRGNVRQLDKLNRAFHRTIDEAARNPFLLEALDNIDDVFSLLPRSTFELPERFEMSVHEHWVMLAAIESRDAEGAEAITRMHVREAQRTRTRAGLF